MKVILIKHIHSCFAGVSSEDIYLEREFDLPFAPYPNMYINYGDFEAHIKAVSYLIEKREFRCYCEEDKEIYDAQLYHKEHRDIKEIVKEYEEIGWEIRKEE